MLNSLHIRLILIQNPLNPSDPQTIFIPKILILVTNFALSKSRKIIHIHVSFMLLQFVLLGKTNKQTLSFHKRTT